MSENNRQITPFVQLKDFLSNPEFKSQIALALPKHLTPDRMLRVALTAALHQPKIAEVMQTANGKASLMKALLTASQLGLEVDGRQGHLVPFNDKRLGSIIQFIPGYQGLIQVAYNHPKVKSIWWSVVHEKDFFTYEDGLNRTLQHRRYEGEGDPGKLTHAYAVCELEGGAKTFVCLNRREVEKAKSASRGADSEYSPWVRFEDAMWAKTAVRSLSKRIPQSTELRSALQAEDDLEAGIDDQRFEAAKPINSPIDFGVSDNRELEKQAELIPEDQQQTPRGRGRPKKEKTEPPPKASNVEGLRNIMKGGANGENRIEEKELLVYLYEKEMALESDTLETLKPEVVQDCIDTWEAIVKAIKA